VRKLRVIGCGKLSAGNCNPERELEWRQGGGSFGNKEEFIGNCFGAKKPSKGG